MKAHNFFDSLSPLRAGVFAFVCVCTVHALYAFFLAVDVPMWDQWDSEAEWYKRLVDGTIDLQSLIAPHNEHRIVFTRLFNGALFSLIGGWSPLLGVYAQIPLIALAVALLCAWTVRFTDRPRLVAIALLVLAFLLPFSWSNILSGFQNQFYFMLLFALLAIYLAALAEHPMLLLVAALLALLSPFTTAGGIATVLVLLGIFALRLFAHPKAWSLSLCMLILLSAGLLLHSRLHVHVAGHNDLHAQNLLEFLRSFIKILGWPVAPIGFIAWAAIGFAIYRWLKQQTGLRSALTNLSGPQRLALGLIGWYLLQAAAIAYSRTHADLMSSRYQQIFALLIPATVLTTTTFGYALPKHKFVKWGYTIFALGLVIRTYKELPYLQNWLADARFARSAIIGAVQKNDFTALKAQDRDGKLGYFNAERIWEQITDPRLRERHLWLKKLDWK